MDGVCLLVSGICNISIAEARYDGIIPSSSTMVGYDPMSPCSSWIRTWEAQYQQKQGTIKVNTLDSLAFFSEDEPFSQN